MSLIKYLTIQMKNHTEEPS